MSTDSQLARSMDIVAALMWGPKTFDDLMEITGASRNAVFRIVMAGRIGGVMYVRRIGKGTRYLVHLQRSPFDQGDEGIAMPKRRDSGGDMPLT